MTSELDKHSENIFNEIGLSSQAQYAGTCVRLGGRRLLAHHRAGDEQLQIRYKSDGTSVTIADEQSETIMSAYIRKYFPYDRIYREEQGISGLKDSKNTIYIDPLDGTNPYTHGERFSTVGFARKESGVTTLSSICNPFNQELYIAEKGKGSWVVPLDERLIPKGQPERLSVSDTSSIVRSVIHVDANFYPNNRDRKQAFTAGLFNLAGGQPFSYRMICSNVGQQAEVAAGRGDATVTDCVGGPYDLFAGELLITEAGGTFTDINGESVTEQTQMAIGSNGALHDLLLQVAQHPYQGYEGFK